MLKPLEIYLDPIHTKEVISGLRPDGSQIRIMPMRLITYANLLRSLRPSPISGQVAISKCIVDTGAPLSIIPERIWRLFIPGLVTPLAFDPSMPPGYRSVTIGGGTFPYSLGEISLRLQDLQGTIMDVKLIAKLTIDGGRYPLPLTLGLRGGFFEGRWFIAEPDTNFTHGQKWTLADS